MSPKQFQPLQLEPTLPHVQVSDLHVTLPLLSAHDALFPDRLVTFEDDLLLLWKSHCFTVRHFN